MLSILGSLFFRVLKNFVWWLSWNIVTVFTGMQGAQHCGQDGRDFLVRGEVPAGDWGKALCPDLTSLPPFAHERDMVALGVPLLSGFLYCTV